MLGNGIKTLVTAPARGAHPCLPEDGGREAAVHLHFGGPSMARRINSRQDKTPVRCVSVHSKVNSNVT